MAESTMKVERYFESDFVKVKVGVTVTKTFHVHRELLIAKSAFFSRAFKEDGFNESRQGEIHLIDETPDTFEPFLYWLYTDRIRELTCEKEATDFTKLYVMADKFCMELLQNRVMDVLRNWYQEEYIFGPTIAYVYEHTMPGIALRKFCAEHWAYEVASNKMLGMDDAALSSLSGSYEQRYLARRDFELHIKQIGDFAYDVCLALQNADGTDLESDPSWGGGCCYHEHKSGVPCHFHTDED